VASSRPGLGHEYNPFRFDPVDPERVHRSFGWGPSLEVFMLDERSYRGPNSPNHQAALDGGSAFLGSAQTESLKANLRASRATWKVVASDMPLGLVVRDGNPDVPKGTSRRGRTRTTARRRLASWSSRAS
jgi:alkaline phosphatase D